MRSLMKEYIYELEIIYYCDHFFFSILSFFSLYSIMSLFISACVYLITIPDELVLHYHISIYNTKHVYLFHFSITVIIDSG